MAGRYQAYPAYKDSRVEWLGEVPFNWKINRYKYALTLIQGAAFKSSEYVAESDVVNIRMGNIKKGGFIDLLHNTKYLPAEYKNSYSQYKLREGDLIIAMTDMSPSLDFLAVPAFMRGLSPNKTYLLNQRVGKLVVDCSFSVGYVKYLLLSTELRNQLKEQGLGTVQSNMSSENLYNSFFVAPNFEKQTQIANFLDHETAKIDTLIEKQQQLIKLLKEKRQTVISHAVTKGLNPDAPMKNSGVDWLREVPAGWGVKRIGLLFTESSSRASGDIELQYPVLSVSIHHGISDKELNEEELDRKVTRSEDRSLYKVVHNNDLAYNMMRAWQGGFGASTLSGLVSPAYIVCKPKTSTNSYYFELVLRTPNAVIELKRYSRGITDFRLRLYWDEFKNIRVPVPPSNEVVDILCSIRKTNSKYDKLISVTERQIGLLNERRTALISAAVTGKIDVRNWQVPEEKQPSHEEVA
jgi:type I restriction enzyme, S subunit